MRLPSLDGGRFFAALLVALYHNSFTVANFTGQRPLDLIFRGGHAGVEYFFVLSGFVILHVHRGDLSRPERVGPFFTKRALRVLPLLWLVLLAWGALRIALSSMTTNGSSDLTTLLLDMLLIPHRGAMVLGVTWTLQRELIFYLLFALAIVSRRWGMAALLAWAAASVATALAGRTPTQPLAAAVLDIHSLSFLMGMAAALVIGRGRTPSPRLTAGLGLTAFALLLLVEWRLGGMRGEEYFPLGTVVGPIAYSLAATAIMTGLARLDQQAPPRRSLLADYGGGSSYALYLVHGPVSSLLVRSTRHWPLAGEVQLAILTAGGVAAALALHVLVERPLLRRLRRPSRRAEG